MPRLLRSLSGWRCDELRGELALGDTAGETASTSSEDDDEDETTLSTTTAGSVVGGGSCSVLDETRRAGGGWGRVEHGQNSALIIQPCVQSVQSDKRCTPSVLAAAAGLSHGRLPTRRRSERCSHGARCRRQPFTHSFVNAVREASTVPFDSDSVSNGFLASEGAWRWWCPAGAASPPAAAANPWCDVLADTGWLDPLREMCTTSLIAFARSLLT